MFESANTLALLGGKPAIAYNMQVANPIGSEEIDAALEVLNSGTLSSFVGDSGSNFLGGVKVKMFEESLAAAFEVKHAISVNSWTSGLWAIIGALEFEPGDEVITSSWTMAATATTILHWNLVPVFADIDPFTFNLDPTDVESRITSRTRAIVSPDIFGQSADIDALRALCVKYGLRLVSDSAQAPMAKHQGKYTSSTADIGGFSFNYHKHIHTGEGGMVVTNDAKLAERVQLLRNHGEVIQGKQPRHLRQFGILGMNLRLGELESAIGIEQLKKLPGIVEQKETQANLFSSLIQDLPGLTIPFLDPRSTHVYYVYGLNLDLQTLGIGRKTLVDALKSEGVPSIMSGYQNIHSLPLFKEEMTNAISQFPYSLLNEKRRMELKSTSLPIAERFHEKTFLGINWCSKSFVDQDIQNMANAFHKVWANLDKLRTLDART